MSELKTKQNIKNIDIFLNDVKDIEKREDSFELLKLMKLATNEEPEIWGNSIIGFGKYNNHEYEWFLTGFSPREQHLTIYIMEGFNQYDELLKNLGEYKIGKSCLYIENLQDVNIEVLKELVKKTIEVIKN